MLSECFPRAAGSVTSSSLGLVCSVLGSFSPPKPFVLNCGLNSFPMKYGCNPAREKKRRHQGTKLNTDLACRLATALRPPADWPAAACTAHALAAAAGRSPGPFRCHATPTVEFARPDTPAVLGLVCRCSDMRAVQHLSVAGMQFTARLWSGRTR